MIKPLPQDRIYMMQHGVSLQDYYSGSAGITLCTPVGPTTTIGEMLDGIESDFNEQDIYEPIKNYGASTRRIERFFAQWLVSVRKENELGKLLMPDLEHDEGYQYFSIEFNDK